jgi:hypothetical protein
LGASKPNCLNKSAVARAVNPSTVASSSTRDTRDRVTVTFSAAC